MQVAKPNTIFLFHMGAFNTLQSILFLVLSTPSMFKALASNAASEAAPSLAATIADDVSEEFVGNEAACVVQGFLSTSLFPLVVWNLAGIHLDRFVTIAYPLRFVYYATCCM